MQIELPEKLIDEIAERVKQKLEAESPMPSEAPDRKVQELQRKLAHIKAKEHITVKEAALLLSCSESHIRKLVMLVRKGKNARPIPFVDMEGVTVFPLRDLLDWATPQSQPQGVQNQAA